MKNKITASILVLIICCSSFGVVNAIGKNLGDSTVDNTAYENADVTINRRPGRDDSYIEQTVVALDKNQLSEEISVKFIEPENAHRKIQFREGVNLSQVAKTITINLTDMNGGEQPIDMNWFWMDFCPGGGIHRNGGFFEGAEKWTLVKKITKGDFDNTDDYVSEWTNKEGLYSKVRTDEDLKDGTTAKGAWCVAGAENEFWPGCVDESKGWTTCEKSFDIGDFIDTSRPGFCFLDYHDEPLNFLYCDYKIHGRDFDDHRDHVYFNIYLDDGNREWPLGYHYHTGHSDMDKNDGWCTDFWDPSYSDCVNPYESIDDYTQYFVVDYTQGNTIHGVNLSQFFNTYGLKHALRFELYIRLWGEYFDDEIVKFWVDNAALKLTYWYDDPPLTPNNPSPSDNSHYTDINSKLRWYGGDPDDYINPMDIIRYEVFFGTSSNPPYVGSIGPYPADNHGPFYWDPGKLSYDKHYFWKIVAVDSYGLKTSSDIWDFYTENSAPKTPDRPSGPSSGWHGTSYSYSTKTSDPDGHSVYYLFDWGDGSTSGWRGPYPSGDQISCSNTWSSPGTYHVKVKAKDSLNAESSWSTILTVSMGNRAPVRPNPPIGPTSGWHGTAYTFSAETTDPENDRIYYKFDWGDGTTSGWVGPAPSGQRVSTDHTWSEPKQYAIRVKAKDVFNKETIWSGYAHINLGNRAPKEPSNPKPNDDDSWVDIDADLSWSCSDPDGDPLTYTLYFGTENPPPKVKDKYDSTSYQLKRLEEKTTYYWKVIATDNFGAPTSSSLWQFTTRSYTPPVLSNYDSWSEGVDIEWGNYSAEFTFRVHYYDADGDTPDKKELVIDDNIFEMTGSGSDADYALTLKGKDVGGGEHYYFFSFTDGTLSQGARLPKDYSWNFTVNYPPNKPEIAGNPEVKKGETCPFEAMAEDEDGDRLWYYFDFGDGENSGWTPILGADSGETIRCNHTFDEIGTYDVRVRARDEYGDIGPWSNPIKIKVPVNSINRHIRIPSFFGYLYEKLNIQKLLWFII